MAGVFITGLSDVEEAEEAEEDELDQLFKKKGRKGRKDKSVDGKKVENFLARMEVAVEMDLEANAKGQPAINKLKLVPELEATLCQRDLHDEFLDGGVLGVLKAWIEPMPDGSLPNLKVRSAVLRVLHQLNFFFEDRKEQLKKSGLGRVVMFLYKLPDETPYNRLPEYHPP
jgi:transcription factor SPN1